MDGIVVDVPSDRVSRTIAFVADGLNLTGHLLAPADPKLLLVMCHGLPSGAPPAPDDAGYAGLAAHVAEQGHAAFWFNFRGVRDAPGDMSLAGWARDLEAALAALHRSGLGAPLVLLGSSAGAAVAVAVAARRPERIAGLATFAAPAAFTFGGLADDPTALLATFRNIGLIRDPAFPPDVRAWRGEFETLAAERHIGQVAPLPLLIVHGAADDVVPYAHAERLFSRAGEPKELVHIPGGPHQLRREPRAVDALLDWMNALARRRA